MKNLQRVSEKVAGNMDEPRLSIAPLIDVCFLLLIFFLVTTTIVPAERDVTKQVPSTGPSRAMTSLDVVIEVRGARGDVVLNPGAFEIVVSSDPSERILPVLEEQMKMLMVGMKGEPPVMVRVDGDAPHQRVIDVMSALQNVGLRNVGLVE